MYPYSYAILPYIYPFISKWLSHNNRMHFVCYFPLIYAVFCMLCCTVCIFAHGARLDSRIAKPRELQISKDGWVFSLHILLESADWVGSPPAENLIEISPSLSVRKEADIEGVAARPSRASRGHSQPDKRLSEICFLGHDYTMSSSSWTLLDCSFAMWALNSPLFTRPAHLTLASGPVLSKLSLASGPSAEDFRASEYEETLLKRTL